MNGKIIGAVLVGAFCELAGSKTHRRLCVGLFTSEKLGKQPVNIAGGVNL